MKWMDSVATLTLAAILASSALGLEAKGSNPRATVPGFVVATDYPSINDALAALPADGGTVYLPAGTYEVKETIDLTGRNTVPRTEKTPRGGAFVRLTGEGRATRLIGRTGGQPVIDLTNSSHCEVSELWISGVSGPEAPDVGILCARAVGLGSAGYHSFYRVMLDGHFTKACVYQISSEVNRWVDCYFLGTAPYGVYISPYNNLEVKSPYAEVQTRGCSNKEGRFIGCCFGAWGPDSIGLVIKGWAEDFSMIGCIASSSNNVAILLDGTEQQVRGFYIPDGLTVEAENGRHVLLAKGTVVNVAINGGSWIAGREVIRSEGTAENWRITNVQAGTWHGHRQVESKREPLPDEEWSKTLEDHGPVALNFENLVNSVIDARNTWFNDRYKETSRPYGRLLIRGAARGNEIQVLRREQLVFAGSHSGNTIQCLHETGTAAIMSIRRASFIPTDVARLPDPRPGEIAMDDGTNSEDGKPALAVFDGEAWVIFRAQGTRIRPAGAGQK